MKINLIIPAGGTSQRFGADNKLFAPCGTSCVIVEAIKPFLSFNSISKIIVAIHPSYSDEFLDALDFAKLHDEDRIKLTVGGDTRTQTVKNALRAVEDDCDYVIIHDGVRPFVSASLISQVIDGAAECGVALPLLDMTDAVVRISDGVIPVDREEYKRVQTPICAEKSRILKAYSECKTAFYDDISVIQTYAFGKVKIIKGDAGNIKITTPSDLKTPLCGIGYDIHRFKEGNGIKLMATFIPCEFSFVAHSDGDVAIHALMDAILTATGEKDIGHLFPVNDEKFDNADSADLLNKVLDITYNKGYRIQNVSVSIIAERPMLAFYIDAMRNNMSAILKIPTQRIGISATTNEGVGDLGDCNSIACFATVLLQNCAL